MALSGYINWEVRPATGSDTACSGGFDPSQTAGMLTDGAATSATGTSPVFSSASYSFVSGDVGAKVYIASGTNWTPGWYAIASVSGGNATLNATANQSTLATGILNGTAGCATTASPTSATWTIDYSQQAGAQISYTDLAIGATNTQLTSSGNPFAKRLVGNIIQVTSGTGFTAGWYTITSVSSVTATMDRAVGTASSTGGHGALGGALATLGKLFTSSSSTTIPVAGNFVWMTGTLTITSTITFTQPSSFATGCRIEVNGYGTYRGDTTHCDVACSTNSVTLITLTAVNGLTFSQFDLTCTAGTPGSGFTGSSNSTNQSFEVELHNCVISGCSQGVIGYMAVTCYQVEVKNCTSDGFRPNGKTLLIGCYSHGNSGAGIAFNSNNNNVQSMCVAIFCVASGNSGVGIYDDSPGSTHTCAWINCVAYNNTLDGFEVLTFVAASDVASLHMINCISYGNGGYGLNLGTQGSGFANMTSVIQLNNAFGSNTSGVRSAGAPPATGDVTLTSNPFNSPSTGDFSLNTTIGGGAACTGAGWQSSII